MAKKKPTTAPEREDRITDEIIVDCHDEEERAMGWYYYLDEQLEFPFTATCIVKRPSSPCRSRTRSK